MANTNFTTRVNDFFRKSLSFIDETDLEREFSVEQAKYGKALLKKDLTIQGLDNEISHFNQKTSSINADNNQIKTKLSTIVDTLKQ